MGFRLNIAFVSIGENLETAATILHAYHIDRSSRPPPVLSSKGKSIVNGDLSWRRLYPELSKVNYQPSVTVTGHPPRSSCEGLKTDQGDDDKLSASGRVRF